MYDPRNLLKQQPVAIASALRSLLMIGVLLGWLALDEKQLAGIALGAELLLGLFAYNASTPTANPTLASGTSVSVKNSEDKVIIETSPPGPTGVEGGPEGPG